MASLHLNGFQAPIMNDPTMLQLQVQGMSCQHCVRAVTAAVQQLDPHAQVEVDLPSGTVQVRSSLPAQAVADAIREEGYDVTV